MEPLFAKLKDALQLMKSFAGDKGEEKRTEVIADMLTNIMEKCIKGGAELDDLKGHITQLYHGELLINEAEYR